MLIDEILFAINKLMETSQTGREALVINPTYRNNEICSLLIDMRSIFFTVKYCESCNKNTIHCLFNNECYSSEHKKYKKHEFKFYNLYDEIGIKFVNPVQWTIK